MEKICTNGEPALAVAIDAYIYGYPLLAMDATKKWMTNVYTVDGQHLLAPLNQFASSPALQDASYRNSPRPNVDTLYSMAWLDVREEPIILSVPDTQGRYYLMEMVDMWLDVFDCPGKRTTGTQAGDFAVVSPTWQGTLPDGIQLLRAPTNNIWIAGRTQTNGPADYDNVHQVQAGYRLTPLSQWGKPYTPPENTHVDPSIDKTITPVEAVDRLDGPTFFARFAELLAQNPPHAVDYPILHRMACLGLAPDRPFNVDTLDAAMLNQAMQEAQRRITYKSRHIGTIMNNWSVNLESVGTYGASYLLRAGAAMLGLGANLPEDAIYPTTFVDADNRPLTGKNAYRLHFEKDQIPPVHAFWSVTLYDERQLFFDNPLNRYALGDRDPLHYNADGSLDIYIQTVSPGKDKEANWIPAPTGSFSLTIRMYWPKTEVLLGKWQPAPVQNLGEVQQQKRSAA